ncbi:MAG: mechanosensitive ion channel family protein [Odoribacter sp.]
MKKISILLLLLCLGSTGMRAQLKDVLKTLITDIKDSSQLEIPDTPTSIRLKQVEEELQVAKINEANLKMETEQLKLALYAADSMKLSRQRRRIDSLRGTNQGMPVVVEGDTLFYVYTKQGGHSPAERAKDFSEKMEHLGKTYNLNPDSVYIEHSDNETDLMYHNKMLVSITDNDALWQNTTRAELAKEYQDIVIDKLKVLKEKHSLLQLGMRIFWFVMVLLLQYLLYRLTTWLYKKFKLRILSWRNTRLKAISLHNYELLDTHKQVRILIFFSNIARYILIGLQLLISVPILFSIFPQTKHLAMKIFSYLWNPMKSILKDVVDYIPDLFTIFVIYFAIRYIIKGIKYLANEIESGKLKISGFYQDWAYPTFHIIRFLLYAFMIAMIYPYLPGSNSGVFQGISVFVGLIISLGSSTVIGNIIAGLVITYMRPFKIGDRIKLNETTGNVIEKTPFVTRLRTPKNELVTIPNSFIMSSHTVNYSTSARDLGLIIHSEVTIGYDAPWRKVHQLLMDAAKATPSVLSEPEPFVLETSLSDWYPVYQVNAFIRDTDRLPQIYSDLHQNIQDKFNEAGVEIMSPQYIATRDGNKSTIPTDQQ